MTRGVARLAAGVLAGTAMWAASAQQQAAPATVQTGKPPLDLSVLHVQVILDHLGFSPGVLDGRRGISLTAALKGFQESRGLPITGETDAATLRALHAYRAWRPTKTLKLTETALAGPFVNPIPKSEAEQAKLPSLGYRTALEKLAEMFHTTPQVLVELNGPDTKLTPGTPVVFPNALPTSRDYDPKLRPDWRQTLGMLNVDANAPKGDKVVVDKSDGVLRVLRQGKLIGQFQVTTGSVHDPLPIGTWKIWAVDYNPKFKYNPALFWDAKRSDETALLPPGPNGPVGVVWLDLNKEHYGLHGTPEPQYIGRSESHGCVRLTNWNAARLALMVGIGTPVIFQE